MKLPFNGHGNNSFKLVLSILVLALVVILVLILVIKQFEKKTPVNTIPKIIPTPTITPTPTPRISETIMATNGKFVPEKLTIKRGTMVNFLNLTNNPIDIKSADHPAHQLYPVLNLGILKTNDTTQSVVFDQPGAYRYHDDNNLKMTGEIIVR